MIKLNFTLYFDKVCSSGSFYEARIAFIMALNMLMPQIPRRIENSWPEGGTSPRERAAGSLRAETRAGVTTRQLDRIAYELIHQAGGQTGVLNYVRAGTRAVSLYAVRFGDMTSWCTASVGFILFAMATLVKLDLGLIYKKFYTDAAVTSRWGGAAGSAGADAVSSDAKAPGRATARTRSRRRSKR